METPILDPTDHQGGKAYGMLMEEKAKLLGEINEEFRNDDTYKDVEDLNEKLNSYKEKFMEFDLDNSGDINYMGLKLMLEKLGSPKTHKEILKIVSEVDTTESGTISYKEFLWMMLGGKNCILRLILFFESVGQEAPKQKGVAPPRTIDSLP
ncbi:allograft inflammatory factor 1-like [Mizuhopecten yessoensis]|uniref:Allograft inflammatory factor 1-like n=1 Tax=Mizuhopecten yessoensis TaxID=6573 RepID=A0A210QAU1_MIZYE|nr:allograft inflammatory factor 1-like [Mizuhopecten yessoensis]OWF45849.1 Allograft inflammatory factor 1-like [Mizuhopecten yessoensis]